MNFLNDLCFLCLVPSKDIKSVLSQGDDDIIIEEKLKCVLSELVNFIPEIPKNICTDCLKGLNYVYKFKQKCLQNLMSLSDHLKTMTENMSFEHFLSNFTEEQCENDQEKQNGVIILKNGGNVAVKTDLDDSETQDESLDETDVYPTEEISGYFNSAATSTASNQKQPNQINSNKTQYKCQECNKVFFCTNLLERHIRTHDIHRYKCTTCQKTFKRPEHLKTHARIHTGEKPYACEVCDKKFAAQSNYISHKRIHANHQPFKCALCDKAFTQSNNLTMHMRVHTGEKPYSCHLCDYKCSQSNNLKIHVRTHTGERPYQCEYCNEAFISANHLTQHMRMKHKDYVQ